MSDVAGRYNGANGTFQQLWILAKLAKGNGFGKSTDAKGNDQVMALRSVTCGSRLVEQALVGLCFELAVGTFDAPLEGDFAVVFGIIGTKDDAHTVAPYAEYIE